FKTVTQHIVHAPLVGLLEGDEALAPHGPMSAQLGPPDRENIIGIGDGLAELGNDTTGQEIAIRIEDQMPVAAIVARALLTGAQKAQRVVARTIPAPQVGTDTSEKSPNIRIL